MPVAHEHDVAGKVVLITGAGSGIAEFLSEARDVVALSTLTEESPEPTAMSISEASGHPVSG